MSDPLRVDPLGDTTPMLGLARSDQPDIRDCPSAGSIVDGYRLDACLGQGGMGQVWHGVHAGLDRLVAVKFLRADLLDNHDAQARFLREIRVAAAIHHPRVVTIWHSGQWGNWLFLVQEFMPGGDAAALLRRRGTLALAEAVALIGDCAEGIAAIHAAGYLHRDLKPQNLLIDAAGRGQVADFGLAVALHGDTNRLTRPGSSPGTPAFMPAEQLRDQPLDTRADVYAWGATAFVLLTGRVPYSAADAFSLLVAQMQGPLPDPRLLNPAVPNALAGLIRRCLATDPLTRPANGQELVRLLAASTMPRPQPALRRLSPINVVVLIGILLSVVGWWFGREPVVPASAVPSHYGDAAKVPAEALPLAVLPVARLDLPSSVPSSATPLFISASEIPPPADQPATAVASVPVSAVNDVSPAVPAPTSAAVIVTLCPTEASSDMDALVALARRWSHASPATSGIALPEVLAADLARRYLGSALQPLAGDGCWQVRLNPSVWSDRLEQERTRAPRHVPSGGDATAWKRMASGLTRALIASAVEGQDAAQVLVNAITLPGNRWCDSAAAFAEVVASDLGHPVRRWTVRDVRTGSTAVWMSLANQIPVSAIGGDVLVLADSHPDGVALLAIGLDDRGHLEGASLAGCKERGWQTQESQVRAVAAASSGRVETLHLITVLGMGSPGPSLILRCHQVGTLRLLAHERAGCRFLGSDRYVTSVELGTTMTIALPSDLAAGEVIHGFLAETLPPRRGRQESSQEAIAWLRGSLTIPSESWICP